MSEVRYVSRNWFFYLFQNGDQTRTHNKKTRNNISVIATENISLSTRLRYNSVEITEDN